MQTNRLKIKLSRLVVNGFLKAFTIFLFFSILSCEQKEQESALSKTVEDKPSETVIPKAVENKSPEVIIPEVTEEKPPETLLPVRGIIADFNKSLPEGFKAINVEAKLEYSPAEKGFLKVLVPSERKSVPQLFFKLPKVIDLSDYYSLSFSMRAALKSESEGTAVAEGHKGEALSKDWRFRWYAVDEKGKQFFQCAFTCSSKTGRFFTPLERPINRDESLNGELDYNRELSNGAGGGELVNQNLPLYLWRWGNDYAGDWAEVTTFVLAIEKGDGEICLNELKVIKGEDGKQSGLLKPDWLTSLAFSPPEGEVSPKAEGSKNRILLKDGFLLATDASDELSDNDLNKLLEKVRPIRNWIRSIFKKSSRPFGGGAPVSLLIFRNTDDFQEFYKRLGSAWGVNISPPKAGGYTVQDIAASTYNDKLGINRPVYFHELIHAVVARELRILSGNPRYNWLQEGIANYLQVCLHPESLKQESFINNFSKPISKDGKSFFKPLEHLLTKRVSMDNYAQLASLVLFLVEKHPDYLDSIALKLADGKEISQILSGLGTSFDKLEEEYLSWGRKTFAPDSEHQVGEGNYFLLPEQWQKSPE